jgi:hypothetical protein
VCSAHPVCAPCDGQLPVTSASHNLSGTRGVKTLTFSSNKYTDYLLLSTSPRSLSTTLLSGTHIITLVQQPRILGFLHEYYSSKGPIGARYACLLYDIKDKCTFDCMRRQIPPCQTTFLASSDDRLIKKTDDITKIVGLAVATHQSIPTRARGMGTIRSRQSSPEQQNSAAKPGSSQIPPVYLACLQQGHHLTSVARAATQVQQCLNS